VSQVSSESGLIDTFAPVFNAFSNQFISATLFGEEVKEAASIPMYSFADRCERSKFCQNYSIPDFWWYAPTGFLEAYQMLSYGGCFLFGLAGYLIFRYSVLAEFAQISYGSASPYLVVLISLAPLVVYTGISYFVLQLTIYLLVIRLSSIQPV